jgi:hypothetical protein
MFLDKKDILQSQENTCLNALSSNIIQLTNVIFSNEFYEDFIKLYDIKKRVDYESKTMPSSFWNEVSNSVNSCSEDDNSFVKLIMDSTDIYYEDLDMIDFTMYDNMDTTTCKKNIKLLFKIRKEIQEMITNLVNIAMIVMSLLMLQLNVFLEVKTSPRMGCIISIIDVIRIKKST